LPFNLQLKKKEIRKHRKLKKSIPALRVRVPVRTIDPQKIRRILGGAMPWLEHP
jgi:hypothetical protein